MPTYTATKNNDGTFSYGGATFRLGDDGNYQLKIMGMWTSGNVDPRAVAAIKALPAETPNLSSNISTQTLLAVPYSPYSLLSKIQRNLNFSNAVSDSFKTGRTIQTVGKQGSVVVGNGNQYAVYDWGQRTPSLTIPRYTDGKATGQQTALKTLPEGATREQVLLATKGWSPANRASALRTYGYDSPLDVTKVAAQEEAETKAKAEAEANAKAAAQANLPYNTFVKNNLGSLTSRRNWVGENSAYLKSKGWTDEEIEGYKGLNLTNTLRAALNLRLAGQLEGASSWNQQRAEALRRERETPEFKFVKEGYDSGRPWTDDELKNMDPEVAKYLDPNDRQRWQRLSSENNRKDIYNEATAVAPYAQVNPTVANPNYGTDIASRPTSPRADFIENVFTQMKPSGIQAGQAATQAKPKTVLEARLQKAHSLTQSSSPIDNALGRMYLAENKIKHKIGGKINYQKIFK